MAEEKTNEEIINSHMKTVEISDIEKCMAEYFKANDIVKEFKNKFPNDILKEEEGKMWDALGKRNMYEQSLMLVVAKYLIQQDKLKHK